MFGRNNNRPEYSDEIRAAAARAQAESWPINDPRANYPRAEQYRRTFREGAALAAEQQPDSSAA